MSTATFSPGAIGAGQELDPLEDRYWDVEATVCRVNPGYMLDQFGKIERPKVAAAMGEPEVDTDLDEDLRGRQPGPVPFRLWAAQVNLMGRLVTERRVIILKARQLGISWLVCGYVLWLCLFFPDQNVLLLSKGQKEANELIRRIKSLYERLPEQLRDRLPKPVGKPGVKKITWSNGSKIESHPSTKSAGVSYTASLVVMDEMAHMIHGEELFEHIQPIMEAGGQMIILSTAKGLGGVFHQTWSKAVAGLNSFVPIFLPWWSRPSRDWGWYEKTVSNANDPDKVPQEYPANPIEAFRASGKQRFALPWISAQADNIAEPLPSHTLPGPLRGIVGLRAYKLPEEGRRYGVFADVAEGKEDGDYDAAIVVDLDTLEEVALLHGQWEPDIYTSWLIALGESYGNAVVVPERNNHGHSVLVALRLKGYPNIGLGHDEDPGWLTGSKGESSKDLSIDLLAEYLREGRITIRSLVGLEEFRTYYRLSGGKLGAAPGFFDDIVMAWSVCLSWIRFEKERAEKRAGRKRIKPGPNPLIGYRG